ncbi:CAP domain-containing protein [Limtongia smithiae]|uniref:CAP domain-containing protein n=1 Tax=Limtongia smithiae TaxID=1125753 RepID=UPI0034CF6677
MGFQRQSYSARQPSGQKFASVVGTHQFSSIAAGGSGHSPSGYSNYAPTSQVYSSASVPRSVGPSTASIGSAASSHDVPTAAMAASGRRMSPVDATADRDACLHVHNAARAAVGVPPVRWSVDLERRARREAEAYARTYTYNQTSSSNGTNSCMVGPAAARPMTAAAQAWAGSGRAAYERDGRPRIGSGNFAAYASYTQMVWRSTTQIGCACVNGFVVCLYTPGGNVINKRPY